ncbi:MAG TPA: YmdB family metallophosphoesterase, partial [bacterium]|nr:YmdB family metallophosphoesterase [bacterium]
GAYEGVIGMGRDGALRRFLTGLPTRFEPAEGDLRLDAVVVDVDPSSGRARAIRRVQKQLFGGATS